MKPTPFIAIGLGLLAVCWLPGGSQGETNSTQPAMEISPKDRAKWRLATLSAAREILDELNQPKPLRTEERAILLEKLNTAMRGDLQAHGSLAASRNVCAEIAIRMRRENMERHFKEVTSHANELSPTPIAWSDVTQHLGTGWSNALERTLRVFTNTELEPLFTDARSRAIGLLRQDLEQRLRYPTEKELNAMLGEILAGHPGSARLSGDDDIRLQQKITALVNPGNSACFEELKAGLNDQTRRITIEIRKQYDLQLGILESTAVKSIPDALRQASSIETRLVAAMEGALAREQAKPAATDDSAKTIPSYPLLSPVLKQIPVMAAKLETERLNSFLEQSPVLAIQAIPLAQAIRANPVAHHTLAASEALFMKSLSPTLQDQALKAYAEGAYPENQTAYFRTLLSTDAKLASAFQSRMTRELGTRLPEARQLVSGEQFTQTFDPLERIKILCPATLSCLQDSGGAALTNIADAMKFFDLHVRENNEPLAETVQRVLAVANQKAQEGYSVLMAQLALVRKLERNRWDNLRGDVATKRAFKQINAEWLEALEADWAATPLARTTPYKELLEPTLESLNKAVRQLYDSVRENPDTKPIQISALESSSAAETEQSAIKEAPQEPVKPQERDHEPQNKTQQNTPKQTQVIDTNAGETKTVASRTRVSSRNEPDGIILLTGTSFGSGIVRFLSQSGTTNCSTLFEPRKPRDAADVIFNIIKPQLKVMWQNTVADWQQEHRGFGFLKRKTPPKLKLFVVIESDEVRHRMSLMLREQIEESFKKWHESEGNGIPEVELDWKVGLTFDQAKQGQ